MHHCLVQLEQRRCRAAEPGDHPGIDEHERGPRHARRRYPTSATHPGALVASRACDGCAGPCCSPPRCLLVSCELPNFGAPDPATEEGESVLSLYQGYVIAAAGVGLLVWALLIYSFIRYRARRRTDIPHQREVNIPIEILYTVLPLGMVAVLFGFSVAAEGDVTDVGDDPDLTVEVLGFQWQWQFTYQSDDGEPVAVVIGDDAERAARAGAPGRSDDTARPGGQRRQPRLLGAELPHQEGPHPRPRQRHPGDPHPHRHLRRLLRRVLRARALAHAVRGADRRA